MKYTTLMFDLDDTLMVERAAEKEAFETACELAHRAYGIDPVELAVTVLEHAEKNWKSLPTYDYCHAMGMSSWEGLWGDFSGDDPHLVLLRSLLGEYREKTWRNALADYDVSESDFAAELSEAYIAERGKRHFAYPGVIETLRELKKSCKLVLLTNGAPQVQKKKLEKAGLDGFFRIQVISGDIGIGKPDRGIFDYALEKSGSSASEALMIGDSLERDVVGASNSGVGTVWINYERLPLPEAVKPDFEIHAFGELLEIVIET